jgi:Mrp family chromosome partitioning ATPase
MSRRPRPLRHLDPSSSTGTDEPSTSLDDTTTMSRPATASQPSTPARVRPAEPAASPAATPDRGPESPSRRERSPRRGGSGAGSWADAADEERGGLLVLDELGQPFAIAPPAVATGLRRFVGRAIGRGDDELPRRIAVTSALAGEGVTFVTRALGAVLAHDLRVQVCIVESNWWRARRRRREQAPAVDDRLGLADVLRGDVDLAQVVRPTSDPLLSVVPAGSPAVRERPVLARSTEYADALRALSEQFDYVLIDLPPASSVAETLTMVQHADGFLLVVQHGVTTEGQVRAALETLDAVPELGVVLNRSNPRVPRRLLRALAPR